MENFVDLLAEQSSDHFFDAQYQITELYSVEWKSIESLTKKKDKYVLILEGDILKRNIPLARITSKVVIDNVESIAYNIDIHNVKLRNANWAYGLVSKEHKSAADINTFIDKFQDEIFDCIEKFINSSKSKIQHLMEIS